MATASRTVIHHIYTFHDHSVLKVPTLGVALSLGLCYYIVCCFPASTGKSDPRAGPLMQASYPELSSAPTGQEEFRLLNKPFYFILEISWW